MKKTNEFGEHKTKPKFFFLLISSPTSSCLCLLPFKGNIWVKNDTQAGSMNSSDLVHEILLDGVKQSQLYPSKTAL
jgi:hypothetical protein